MAIQKQIQTSSASKEKVIIEDLRPRHTTKLIHVKVHSWIQNIQLSAEAMEFILADENVSNRNCLFMVLKYVYFVVYVLFKSSSVFLILKNMS